MEIGWSELLIALVGLAVAGVALRNEAVKAMIQKAQQADADERAVVDDLRGRLTEFHLRLKTVETDRDTAQRQAQMLTERVRSLEADNERKQAAIDALEAAYKAAQAEVDTLRQAQAALQEELKQKGGLLDDLRGRLREAEKQATKAQAEAEAYGTVLNRMMERLEHLTSAADGGTPRPA